MAKLADLKVFATRESKTIFNVKQYRKEAVVKFVANSMNIRNKFYP